MWGAGEPPLHFGAHGTPQPGEHQLELLPGGQAQMPCRPPSVGSLQWVDGTSQSLTLATSKERGTGGPVVARCTHGPS